MQIVVLLFDISNSWHAFMHILNVINVSGVSERESTVQYILLSDSMHSLYVCTYYNFCSLATPGIRTKTQHKNNVSIMLNNVCKHES